MSDEKEKELKTLIEEMFSIIRGFNARLTLDSAKAHAMDMGLQKIEEHFKDVVEVSGLMVGIRDVLGDLTGRSTQTIHAMTKLENRMTAVETAVKTNERQVMLFGEMIRQVIVTLKELREQSAPKPGA